MRGTTLSRVGSSLHHMINILIMKVNHIDNSTLMRRVIDTRMNLILCPTHMISHIGEVVEVNLEEGDRPMNKRDTEIILIPVQEDTKVHHTEVIIQVVNQDMILEIILYNHM